MKILKNIQVPTGNICIMQGEKGKLEFLSIGDYGMVADGIHRCIRAICEGKSYIMAYRLTSMP